jgi:hypothetical protein
MVPRVLKADTQSCFAHPKDGDGGRNKCTTQQWGSGHLQHQECQGRILSNVGETRNGKESPATGKTAGMDQRRFEGIEIAFQGQDSSGQNFQANEKNTGSVAATGPQTGHRTWSPTVIGPIITTVLHIRLQTDKSEPDW